MRRIFVFVFCPYPRIAGNAGTVFRQFNSVSDIFVFRVFSCCVCQRENLRHLNACIRRKPVNSIVRLPHKRKFPALIRNYRIRKNCRSVCRRKFYFIPQKTFFLRKPYTFNSLPCIKPHKAYNIFIRKENWS